MTTMATPEEPLRYPRIKSPRLLYFLHYLVRRRKTKLRWDGRPIGCLNTTPCSCSFSPLLHRPRQYLSLKIAKRYRVLTMTPAEWNQTRRQRA